MTRAASILASLLASPLLAAPAAAQDGKAEGAETAHAQLEDAQGKQVGSVRIRETPNGVILAVRFTGVPAGEHAFHVHQVGKCEAPFESAGDHYNPGKKKHGFAVAGGPHAGDLPNVTIPEGGDLEIEVFVAGLSVRGDNALLDPDGSALIVHEKTDDYSSQPSGDAGGRIACGVVKAGDGSPG